MADSLLSALKSIADENGLDRIDLGYAGYCDADRQAYVSIWYDAPEGVNGHNTGAAADFDSAIDDALLGKARKLASTPIAEAA